MEKQSIIIMFLLSKPLIYARGKHKNVAVYLMFVSLPLYISTHKHTIPLSALCEKKLFNHKNVYGTIVKDIKIIAEKGIEISPNIFIKETVVLINDNNLGNHSFGGFVENFTNTKYFFRYCLINLAEFWSKKIRQRRNMNKKREKKRQQMHTMKKKRKKIRQRSKRKFG